MRVWTTRVSNLPLDDMETGPFGLVLDAWQQGYRRGADDAPRRIALSIAKPVLPYMALIDVDTASGEPAYRIFGDALKRLLGFDGSGRTLREVYHPTIFREIRATLTAAAVSRAPIFTLNEFTILWKVFGYRRLVLPLAKPDGEPGRAIVVLQPINETIRTASDWRRFLAESEQAARDRDADANWLQHLHGSYPD